MLFQSVNKNVLPQWACASGGLKADEITSYIDLLGDQWKSDTSSHYSHQWGNKVDFLGFMQKVLQAKKMMPVAKLGWGRLFAKIRGRAQKERIYVYDAACGYGGRANEIVGSGIPNRLVVGLLSHGAQLRKSATDFVECFMCNVAQSWYIRDKNTGSK